MLRVCGVVGCEVGEVLHVDLDGGRLEAVAVVLVESGAGGVVAVVADDDVGIRPVGTARLAQVTEPAALGAVGPFLGDVGDTQGVFASVDLHVGGLVTWGSGLVDGDVLEGSRRDVAVSSPGADEGLVLVVDVDLFYGSVGIG